MNPRAGEGRKVLFLFVRRGYRPGKPVESRMYPRRFYRTLIAAVLGLFLAACSTLNGLGALLGNEVRFTPMQLQGSLDRNFPKHYDKLGGLVSMTLLNPRLSIPQGSDRLRLDFDVGLGALGSDSS